MFAMQGSNNGKKKNTRPFQFNLILFESFNFIAELMLFESDGPIRTTTLTVLFISRLMKCRTDDCQTGPLSRGWANIKLFWLQLAIS